MKTSQGLLRDPSRPGPGKVPVAEMLVITGVTFAAARPEDIERGLLGWASFLLGGVVRLDGVAVRRTLEGRYALSFPARRDGAGRRHFSVRPVDNQARLEIEHVVLGALGFIEEAR